MYPLKKIEVRRIKQLVSSTLTEDQDSYTDHERALTQQTYSCVHPLRFFQTELRNFNL